MRKFWLIFAQSVTISLAVLFAVQQLHPTWLCNPGKQDDQIIIQQAEKAVSTNNPYSYSRAAKKAMPSVVNIFTSKKISRTPHPLLDDPLFQHFFGNPQEDQPQAENSLGSGVIVSSQGFILTNHHVIETADEIEIALADGRTFPARVVGTDPESDIAVLKVESTNLSSMTFAADKPDIGDVVLAIGNPFGVGQTVTQGIVSALGRNHLGINTFENFIQTDASINPGNSGGALIDISGNLVGINSAIYSRSGGSQGIGFAIPVSLAKQVMEQIVTQGGVTRGWIGIEAQDITPDLAESFKLKSTRGSLIAGILRNSPADHAGLKPGDILLAIDKHEVSDSSTMLNLIATLKPEKQVVLTIMRNQTNINVPITVGKRPKPKTNAAQE